MKKLLVILIVVLGLYPSFSQTVNDIPIKDIDVRYIQIVGTSKLFSKKVTIEIDFGQENKFWTAKDTQLKDEFGKLLVFNSMIDALNFLTKNGYRFVNAYAITIGDSNVYHYMLEKE